MGGVITDWEARSHLEMYKRRIAALEAENTRLREGAQGLIDDVPVCVCADHWKGIGRISPSCCRCHLQPELDELIAALEPSP